MNGIGTLQERHVRHEVAPATWINHLDLNYPAGGAGNLALRRLARGRIELSVRLLRPIPCAQHRLHKLQPLLAQADGRRTGTAVGTPRGAGRKHLQRCVDRLIKLGGPGIGGTQSVRRRRRFVSGPERDGGPGVAHKLGPLIQKFVALGPQSSRDRQGLLGRGVGPPRHQGYILGPQAMPD